MATTTLFSAEPLDTVKTTLAQQDLAKWQADRECWEETLPIMSWLSQFLVLAPVASEHGDFASTDGRYLYFCPAYSATLSDEARVFLQAHLIWHCVAGHLAAPLVTCPHRWHLACDHEVNSLLLALGIRLPYQALVFPVCFGLSATRVYRWLAGHPCPGEEKTLDVHPAAMGARGDASVPDIGLAALWRRRAHVAARNAPALPPMVAEFCAAR
ncbi:hypothetical protein QC823_15800 [Halomonas vilamensis]|uniref:Putative metallopeptidase domain-containing protein n=1 Tax=Vreelandella vilamensis TaxID=531309 RepID=A0ABU1H7Z1_9GAMM|nr:hypothetical protein [Halomonas vilamensis]MDR5900428.1 hypothetical protein [Halomonas vilamensis]